MATIRFYRAVGEYGFLSNLYRMEVGFSLPDEYLSGSNDIFRKYHYFNTTEAAYQYGKPISQKVAEWIIAAPKPHLIAMSAHGLFTFDIEPSWNQRKVERMRTVLALKFARCAQWNLSEKLLATGNAEIIEESKSDSFWGIGKNGKGKNMLGVLLMERRDALLLELDEHRKQVRA